MPCPTCCQANEWSTSRLIDPVDASVLGYVDRFPAIRDFSNGLTPVTWHVADDGGQYLAEWGDTGSGALPNRDPRGELCLYDASNSYKLKWRCNATTPNNLPSSLETTNLLFTTNRVWCVAGTTTIRNISDGTSAGTVSGSDIHARLSVPHGVYVHTFNTTSDSRIRRYDESGSLVDESDNFGTAGFPTASMSFLAKTGTTYDELTDLTDLTVETGYTAAGAGTVTWIGAEDSGIYRIRGNLFEKYKAGSQLFSFDMGAGHGFTAGHVFDGLVFLRNAARTNLSCRDGSDGTEKWNAAWSLDQTRSRHVKSVLYMPTGSNEIQAVDPSDGSVYWTSSDHECVTGYDAGASAVVWLGGNRVAN